MKLIRDLLFASIITIISSSHCLADTPYNSPLLHDDFSFSIIEKRGGGACPPLKRVTLSYKATEIVSENTVREFLFENGLKYNIDILSMIYELNPKITDIKYLQKGTSIILPQVKNYPTDSVNNIDISNCLFDFHSFPNLKADFRINVGKLESIASLFDEGKIVFFDNENTKNNAHEAVFILSKIEEFIHENTLPFSYETISALNKQSLNLLTILSSPTSPTNRLSTQDSIRIKWYKEDFAYKLQTFQSTLMPTHKTIAKNAIVPVANRSPYPRRQDNAIYDFVLNFFEPKRNDVLITVITMYSKHPFLPASNLRIHYGNYELRDMSEPFSTLTDKKGKSEKVIPTASRYDFWAVNQFSKKVVGVLPDQKFPLGQEMKEPYEIIVDK